LSELRTEPECKVANGSFENVAKFKYFIMTQIRMTFMKRLNSGNACYYLVQNLMSFIILKKPKTKIYKTVILPVVLYGCKTLSLTLGEKHRLRVFESRVLRRIFGPKREEDKS
jgi:hypothetical protein